VFGLLLYNTVRMTAATAIASGGGQLIDCDSLFKAW
jgi:hypothetical protein